jgi:hypothetical protein
MRFLIGGFTTAAAAFVVMATSCAPDRAVVASPSGLAPVAAGGAVSVEAAEGGAGGFASTQTPPAVSHGKREQGAPAGEARVLRGQHSTSAPFKKAVRGACLSRLGCPFEPAEIPVCASELSWLSLGEALAAPAGTRVTVSGALMLATEITRMACEKSCCNSAEALVYLHSAGVALGLRDDRHPNAFRCFGDDSEVCCGLAPLADKPRGTSGSAIIASGALQHDERGQHYLDRPELCRQR